MLYLDYVVAQFCAGSFDALEVGDPRHPGQGAGAFRLRRGPDEGFLICALESGAEHAAGQTDPKTPLAQQLPALAARFKTSDTARVFGFVRRKRV